MSANSNQRSDLASNSFITSLKRFPAFIKSLFESEASESLSVSNAFSFSNFSIVVLCTTISYVSTTIVLPSLGQFDEHKLSFHLSFA